jgi:tyrosine-specific transport protein
MYVNKINPESNKKLIISIAMIVGLVVGAGVLGIPYAVSQVGFFLGISLIIFSAFVVFLNMLYVAELTLFCRPIYQLPGLVREYLGKKAGWVLFISFVISVYGATTAYLVGSSQIITSLFGLDINLSMIIYFSIIFVLVTLGLGVVAKSQLVLGLIKVGLVIILSLFLLPQTDLQNITTFNPTFILASFGVALFASLGTTIVPEVAKYLKEDKKKMVKSITFSSIITTTIYVVFALAFVGTFGSQILEVATQSLSGIVYIFGSFFALTSMTTAYLAQGIIFKDSLLEDYNLKNKLLAAIIACFPSFLTAVFINPGFVDIISFTGVYVASINGILVSLAVIKARKKHYIRLVPFGNIPLYFLIVLFSFIFFGKTFNIL